MAEIEVVVPTQLETEIDQLVEEGEFLTRQEAVEDLLTTGLSTYQPRSDSSEDEGDLAFADEMRNPGDEPMGTDEDPSF